MLKKQNRPAANWAAADEAAVSQTSTGSLRLGVQAAQPVSAGLPAPVTWEALTCLAALDAAVFGGVLPGLEGEVYPAVLCVNFESAGGPSVVFIHADLSDPRAALVAAELEEALENASVLRRLSVDNRIRRLRRAVAVL